MNTARRSLLLAWFVHAVPGLARRSATQQRRGAAMASIPFCGRGGRGGLATSREMGAQGLGLGDAAYDGGLQWAGMLDDGLV